MSFDYLSEYQTTAGDNTAVGSVNIQENCAPSVINNAIREVMSHLAGYKAETETGAAVASATALLVNIPGVTHSVTSTTTITSLAAPTNDTSNIKILVFADALTFTHSANLILPASSNITTVAGDVAYMVYEGSSVWRCVSYIRADGKPVVGGDVVDDTTPQLGGNLDANSNQSNLPIGWGNVLAPHEGLICKYVTTATVDIDADAVYLRDTSNYVYKASSVNLTVDITASGANGLDTGSEATSTWYYLWVIYNGTTVAGLLSTSSTGPTMPSGYTYKGLVGAIYNDSGSDFDKMHQQGARVIATSKTALSAGSATTATSVSLATMIPPVAKTVIGVIAVDDDASNASSVGNIYADSSGVFRTAWISNVGQAAVDIASCYWENMVITAQTLWYDVNASGDNMDIFVTGWEY